MKTSKTTQDRLLLLVLFRWWRIALFISAALAVWLLISHFELLGRNFYNSSVLVVAVVLYLLAFPSSVLLRLDKIGLMFGAESSYWPHLIALGLVWINFTLLGGLQGLLRRFKGARAKDLEKADGDDIDEEELSEEKKPFWH